MAIKIEKSHIEICDNISEDINKHVNAGKKEDTKECERLLKSKQYSIEDKKKELVLRLHRLMVYIFAKGISKKSKQKYFQELKKRLLVLIGIATKINRINYYIQSVFLREIGAVKPEKKSYSKEIAQRHIKKEPEYISRDDLAAIENTVCRIIERIIYIDKKLIKDYKKREEKVVAEEKVEIKDLENVIGKESELLDHIEAKLPPPMRLQRRLIQKQNFSHWMLTTLALLSAFENEYRKETIIFNKLKQDSIIRKKIGMKMSQLIKEKEGLFRIKEKKLKSLRDIGPMEREFKEAVHNFASASSL